MSKTVNLGAGSKNAGLIKMVLLLLSFSLSTSSLCGCSIIFNVHLPLSVRDFLLEFHIFSCGLFFPGSVQFSSVTQLCPTLCDPMNRSTPGLPVHHHLSEFTQTHVHRVRDAIQPSHPGSSPSPPAPNPPSIRVFSNESTLRMRWPKYWSFSFSIEKSF